MKNKIGTAKCLDCDYPDCDVGLDKKGHPYLVCWGECGGEQFFTKGKKPKVRSLLDRAEYRPIKGGPSADELRAKYGLIKAPSAADAKRETKPKPAAKPAPAPVAAPQAAARRGFTTLMDEG